MRAEESPIRPRSCLALVAAALLATGGCARPPRSNTPPAPAPEPPPFKIGVMTGTAAQGAEEFHAGAEIERRYPKRVMHVTFPDRFPAESVTVVAQLTGLASDPRVRVILVDFWSKGPRYQRQMLWIVLAIWVIVAGMGVGRQLFYMITTEL